MGIISFDRKFLSSALMLAAVFLINAAALGAVSSKEQQARKETPKKPVTVTSDRMEADQNEKIVVFKGNVVAVEDFTLNSDVLFVYYDDNKEIRDIVAEGNVKIYQEDKTSTSDKATYNRKDRVIVLTGNPQVNQCEDIVKGDKITVYMDENKALVESGQGGRVRAVIMPEKKDCASSAPSAEKGNK